ncbi:hypothetical protein ACN2WE_30885 [Streptomyces sp. cg28]|uniref:hypothetical protein n=1 Tax=Streptomyces sp. cg28 TaxID=3403457 RepID=UPI003B21F16A
MQLRGTRFGAHLPSIYDQVGQLHSLAERIHNAADGLPLSDSVYSGVSNLLDDLADSTRDVAGLVSHLAIAAAFTARTAPRRRGPEADTTRHTVAQLTHSVGTLGIALADLGVAVAHAGQLHEFAAAPRSMQRNQDIESTRALLYTRIDSARARLNASGARLHQAADRLTPVPALPGSLRANAASPVTPPRASRSRIR